MAFLTLNDLSEATKRSMEAVMVAGLISLPKGGQSKWSSEPTNAIIYYARPTFSGPKAENPKKAKFETLAKQWRKETRNCSVLAQRYAHPAYRKILAMGPEAIPWILNELKYRPDRWFSALSDLAEYYEIGPDHSFESAVGAWLKWGRDNNYNV